MRRDRHYNGKTFIKKKEKKTMVVKILNGELTIKQDEQTQSGCQIVE